MNRLADYYELLFKRKSFHLFRNVGEEKLTKEELDEIEAVYETFVPLRGEIRTAIRIFPEKESSCHRGNEYTIYFYSEKHEQMLQNIGYLGEQMDLYLTGRNIGTLWYGIGKPAEKTFEGLEFVIMMGIRKVPENSFRKDMFKAKRKFLDEVWKCSDYADIGNVVRFAPSACNTQPWLVEGDGKEITVYRYKKQGLRGIMPAVLVTFYNRIDIGILLFFLEVCLSGEGISFERELFVDDGEIGREKSLTAKYYIH